MIRSFFRLLVRSYQLAVPYGRLRLFAVLSVILFNGLLQLIGVTSIFPFFALAAETERIRNSTVGTLILRHLPTLSNKELLVLAGCFSIVMLLLASIGNIGSEVIRTRYALGFCHWLRGKVFESYASQPYGFFLLRNSSKLNQKISDAMTFTQNVLLPLGELLTRIFMVILLIGVVFFLFKPWISISAFVFFGGFYFIVFLWIRPRSLQLGNDLLVHNIEFAKNTGQFFGGIKTVLVHGKSWHFIRKAMEHSSKVGYFNSLIPLYTNGPRYVIEPIAFGGLVLIVIILALEDRPFSDILPNVSVIGLASYRLMPALQIIYSQLVTISANHYTLRQLEEEIFQIENELSLEERPSPIVQKISFNHEIKIDKITFNYPNFDAPILNEFSLTIPKNKCIGISGTSGSGKSTLVDLILGLHTPQKGNIQVDGQPINKNNADSWRRIIGYVPQDIFLLDDTIQENIAFGIDPENVDQKALREAAEGAQILDFIDRELTQGFQTIIGERGVRLSGGQRQRVGLARALYHRPQVLILNEATSALDLETEKAVMDTIHRLQGSLTIITIAHRLSTLEKCDYIINITRM